MEWSRSERNNKSPFAATSPGRFPFYKRSDPLNPFPEGQQQQQQERGIPRESGGFVQGEPPRDATIPGFTTSERAVYRTYKGGPVAPVQSGATSRADPSGKCPTCRNRTTEFFSVRTSSKTIASVSGIPRPPALRKVNET